MKDILKKINRYKKPIYIYRKDTISAQYNKLISNINYKKLSIHYACKANSNLEVLRHLKDLGSNIECVSIGEIRKAIKAGFEPENIVFTCSNLSTEELKKIAELKVQINLDSFSQIRRFGAINPGAKVGVRLNHGIGGGQHEHVITGGENSKFGIYSSRINEIENEVKKANLKLVGLHQHIGSGILDPDLFIKAMEKLISTALDVKGLEYLDFGGGFGIPYRPGESELNMEVLGKLISEKLESITNAYGSELEIKFEPGRYLVGQSGILVAEVTEVKETPHRTFIGINTGFNHLVRPAMYGSYHEIENLTSEVDEIITADIVGNICESGDSFAKDRKINKTKEGDILIIKNVGAYGFTMASRYNERDLPNEILI